MFNCAAKRLHIRKKWFCPSGSLPVRDPVGKHSYKMEEITMKHIMTLNTRDMVKSAENGGCGECQTSCQSACKTSCGIANQDCENKNN